MSRCIRLIFILIDQFHFYRLLYVVDSIQPTFIVYGIYLLIGWRPSRLSWLATERKVTKAEILVCVEHKTWLRSPYNSTPKRPLGLQTISFPDLSQNFIYLVSGSQTQYPIEGRPQSIATAHLLESTTRTLFEIGLNVPTRSFVSSGRRYSGLVTRFSLQYFAWSLMSSAVM